MLRLSSTRFFNIRTVALGMAVTLCVFLSTPHTAIAGTTCEHCGWFWYDKETPKDTPEKSPKESIPPSRPDTTVEYTSQELWNMEPAQFKQTLNLARDTAVRTLSVEDVAKYLRYQKIARDKAAAFANVSMMATRLHPELSSARDYPIAAGGRKAIIAERQKEISRTIRNARNDFALIYFYAPDCSFCAAQNGALRYFTDKYRWKIKPVNVDERPNVASRFNVTTTPTLLLVYKMSGGYIIISSGVAAVSEIERKTFQGIRLLIGQVKPQQLSLYDFQRGGYFDPLSTLNGKTQH